MEVVATLYLEKVGACVLIYLLLYRVSPGMVVVTVCANTRHIQNPKKENGTPSAGAIS